MTSIGTVEHMKVCFVDDYIYVHITMSINDEKVNNVNADMVMTEEYVCMH